MWLVTTVLNRAVLGTMRNTDQVSIIWMSWQSARRYYMCPNFSDEENETHRGCMICPKWRSNDCTARSQLCFWWDPMLGTIGLHHHRTWRDGWVEEYKFFGGYSLNSGFFIPTFFFFFSFLLPSNTQVYADTYTHVLDQQVSTLLKLVTTCIRIIWILQIPRIHPYMILTQEINESSKFMLLIFQISDLDAH